MNVRALEQRLEALADDVGRGRRQVEPGSSLAYLFDRIAGHVATLYLIVTPCAAELAAVWAPGDEVAVAAAVEIVDQEWERLLARLGVAES